LRQAKRRIIVVPNVCRSPGAGNYKREESKYTHTFAQTEPKTRFAVVVRGRARQQPTVVNWIGGLAHWRENPRCRIEYIRLVPYFVLLLFLLLLSCRDSLVWHCSLKVHARTWCAVDGRVFLMYEMLLSHIACQEPSLL